MSGVVGAGVCSPEVWPGVCSPVCSPGRPGVSGVSGGGSTMPLRARSARMPRMTDLRTATIEFWRYQKLAKVKRTPVPTTARLRIRDVAVWPPLMSSTPRYTATNCLGSERMMARRNSAGCLSAKARALKLGKTYREPAHREEHRGRMRRQRGHTNDPSGKQAAVINDPTETGVVQRLARKLLGPGRAAGAPDAVVSLARIVTAVIAAGLT